MSTSKDATDLVSHRSSTSKIYEVPDCFLYTTLNQNQTKDLRKSATNRDERKTLNSIFGLNAIRRSPNQEVNKVDELILDFHCINFNFCCQHQYSNEKVSTLLGIMDFILHTMIKRQLQVEQGTKLLKEILSKHKLHRPPYSILIFSEAEVSDIQNFMLNTFFRHYCLYEYSFKPKVDIILMTLPKGGIPKSSTGGDHTRMSRDHPDGSVHEMDYPSQSHMDGTPMEQMDHEMGEQEDPNIDWQKVGRLYKPESAIDHIVNKEMTRLRMAFEQNIVTQDQALEDKFKPAKKK